MKGIVLAGGTGTRLHPLTHVVSKQLLPVYDKPMIYYPISVLMLAGIREILVITGPQDADQFVRMLGDGSQWGLSLSYAEQAAPTGIAEAFLIGADFLGGGAAALVLGDNIFFRHNLSGQVAAAATQVEASGGCTLFGYRVADPERYGVAVLGRGGELLDIEEKPAHPQSNMAITGLYFYGTDVVDLARELTPSERGELEITDLNRRYIAAGTARLVDLGRGTAWLDTGTQDSLLQAAQFVQVLQHRQGFAIACLEEIAMRQGWIDPDDVIAISDAMGDSRYGRYLRQVALEYADTAG